jgi:hypothetical protein
VFLADRGSQARSPESRSPKRMAAAKTAAAYVVIDVELGKQSAANDSSCEWRLAQLLSGMPRVSAFYGVVIYMYGTSEITR